MASTSNVDSPVHSDSLSALKRFAIGAGIVWTLIIGGSLWWNLYLDHQQSLELAHKEAIANFNKDQGFRLWGTRHGGVYVPISEETPPSPYMSHIEERDIETPSGKKLTLLNPAYMVRQLMEDYNELYGIRGKITGKVVLRPGNAPDDWESDALDRLAAGADEVMEITEIDNEPYMRLMRPMYMVEGCDKCHGHLGFKTGDFRGGVDVSIPLTPYFERENERKGVLWGSHAAIWLLGLFGIGFGARQTQRHIVGSLTANRSLKESEERLQIIGESAPAPLLIARRDDAVIVYKNGRAANFFGYRAGEMIGKQISDLLVNKEDASKLKAGLDALGEVNDYEVDFYRADGTQRTGQVSLQLLNWDGQDAMLAAITDITQRKEVERKIQALNEELEERVEERTLALENELQIRRRAEEMSRQYSERLKNVLDTAADGIITIDTKGQIETFNKAAERIFGFSRDEIIGQNISLLMPDGPAKDHDNFIQRFVQTGEQNIIGVGREVIAERKNGDQFPLYLAVSTAEVDGKRFFTGIVRDMTDAKKTENALRIARDQAQNANRAKSEFLSSMSHELRTPLNGILGFAQLLEFNPKIPLSEQQTEYVGHILTAGNHLLSLINEVLDLSKIESGNISLSIEAINPQVSIDDCVSLVRPMAEKHGITIIDKTKNTEVATILADMGRFRQIMVNLTSNAIKYNKPGGTVTIEAEPSPNRDSLYRFSVTDTGYGIPDDKIGDLFEPFNRLGAEGGEIEGSGIGLTITRMLVELMDGSIGVRSKTDVGTTFWIDLPVATLENTPEAPAEKNSDDTGNLTIMAGQHTLLYVEDNPANLKLMTEVIGNFDNLTMLSATNAEDGLTIARKERPSVIVLDINLPGMDGFQALARLQYNERTADIPVIALSASAMPKDVERGLKAGFQNYLTKPIKIPRLIQAINVALKSKGLPVN